MRQLAFLSLLWVVIAQPALAHGFDGRWCSPDGDRIIVNGASVITPEGNMVSGENRGRAYMFILPEGEFGAGTEMWLELEDNGNLRVSRLQDSTLGPPPHDEWTRCDPVS